MRGCLFDHLCYVCIIYEKTKRVTQLPWDLHWETKNIQDKQVKDHISFGPTSGSTVDQYIGCYVSRYSVDSQPRCQSRVDRQSTKYWPTSWLRVVFLLVECRSTDSISSMSAMYRWILGQVLVRYRWCIGWQLALPTVGRYVGHVMLNSQSRINQQNRLTVGHDSIGSVLPVYRWTIGWLSVRYWWCISRQSL